MQLWDRDSEALLAISGTEGAQLHGRLGRHHLGGPVRRDVDALGLLLLDLLLDPEVGEPKPVLHARFDLQVPCQSGSGIVSCNLCQRYTRTMRCQARWRRYLEPHCRSPPELLLDKGVVRVAPADTLWTRDVVDRQLPILKAQHDLNHLVHAHHLVAPNVHRLAEIRLGQSGQNFVFCAMFTSPSLCSAGTALAHHGQYEKLLHTSEHPRRIRR